MRHRLVRAAALSVVCVFASLPALARAHDRVSTHDTGTIFRLSKNLERPHEKVFASAIVSRPVTVAAPDATPCGDVTVPHRVALPDAFVFGDTARAPPTC